MKAEESKAKKRFMACAMMLAAVAMVGAVCWGCSPKAASDASSSGQQSASEEKQTSIDASAYPNFTDNDSGMFPDNYTNTDMLNAGNRGCNSCHSDLFDVMQLKGGNNHILVKTGYDKNLTYKDCEPCHRGHSTLTGPYLGDLIHASHYSNDTFVNANGNCWSCHAVNSDGAQGDYQFMLWDDFYESGAVGGYVWADSDVTVRNWTASRGAQGGYLTEVSLDSAPTVDVSFDQKATDHDDVFVVNNWGREVTEKNGEAFDFDEVCNENNAVSITGVNNPKSFTKAELQAMPQTEFTMHLACATNGQGGSLVSNIPMTGVSMEYIIDQCGGLVDGNNAVNATAYDGWSAFVMPLVSSIYTQDAYLVTQYYGEDLTQDDGAPIVLVAKGEPGARHVKHVKSIDFCQSDAPFNDTAMAMSDEPTPSYAINGMWFQNNGNTYKVGEKVDLSGAVYSWNRVQGNLASVKFSFDMGQNWTEYQVSDVLSDFDPAQWISYDVSWTPKKVGTYEIKMSATDDQGNEMKEPVTLFVKVEE